MHVSVNDVSSLPDVTLFTALPWIIYFKIKKNLMINTHTDCILNYIIKGNHVQHKLYNF